MAAARRAAQGRVPEGFPSDFKRDVSSRGAADDGDALLERERELKTLRDGIARARAGDGTLMLIEGPAGVGKTQLVREARAAAEQAGVMPLEARGSELEQPFAFGVVRQLLEPASGDPALFAGAAGPAARLFERDERPSPGTMRASRPCTACTGCS